MTLGSPDSNGLGRYQNSTSIGNSWPGLLNMGLASVSVRFTAFLLGDTGWLTPTIKNGWVSSSAQYRRLNGIVYLRGRVAETTATFNNCFDLPAGFRPPVDMNFVILAGDTYPGTAERCQISSGGTFEASRFVETTKNLDGVSFPAS